MTIDRRPGPPACRRHSTNAHCMVVLPVASHVCILVERSGRLVVLVVADRSHSGDDFVGADGFNLVEHRGSKAANNDWSAVRRHRRRRRSAAERAAARRRHSSQSQRSRRQSTSQIPGSAASNRKAAAVAISAACRFVASTTTIICRGAGMRHYQPIIGQRWSSAEYGRRCCGGRRARV